MRALLILVVFLAGCAAPPPVFSIADRAGLGAYLAFQVVAYSSPAPTPAPTPAPSPAPAPQPSPSGEVCPECNGRGKQGDGTIDFPCDACGGTGRVTSAPKPVAKPVTKSVTKAAPAVVRMPGPSWNVEGKNNYTMTELADHLRRSHGVNVNGKTFQQLQAIHANIHNGYSASGSSCPNGRCPTR